MTRYRRSWSRPRLVLLLDLDEDPLAPHLSAEPFQTRPLFRLTATTRGRTWSLLWALRRDGTAFVVDIGPDI